MPTNVRNLPSKVPGADHLLAVAYKAVAPKEETATKRCRFDLFVRKKEEYPSFYSKTKGGPTRTWCLRGDKYTDQEYKMLRNLLSHLHKFQEQYELAELYDNEKKEGDPERIILKFHKGVVEINNLNRYSFLLQGYVLPVWMK